MLNKLILLFLLISNFSISQTNDTIYTITSNGIVKSIKETKDWYNNTPGQEFQKYAIHTYTGLALNIIGTTIIFTNTDNSDILDNPILLSGGLISLVGIGFMIESHLHIGRAGILLERDRVGIKINF